MVTLVELGSWGSGRIMVLDRMVDALYREGYNHIISFWDTASTDIKIWWHCVPHHSMFWFNFPRSIVVQYVSCVGFFVFFLRHILNKVSVLYSGWHVDQPAQINMYRPHSLMCHMSVPRNINLYTIHHLIGAQVLWQCLEYITWQKRAAILEFTAIRTYSSSNKAKAIKVYDPKITKRNVLRRHHFRSTCMLHSSNIIFNCKMIIWPTFHYAGTYQYTSLYVGCSSRTSMTGKCFSHLFLRPRSWINL